MDNMYMFGDKLEEKLSKVVTAKQKSKSLFHGLHGQKKQNSSSYGMDSQPFRHSPLPKHQQSVKDSCLQEQLKEEFNFI